MRCILLGLLALGLLLPVSASASDPPSPRAMAEFEELNDRLSRLQERAMRDASIQREYGALQELVALTMDRIDPETPDRRARLLELVSLLEDAHEIGDDNAYDVLSEEGEALEMALRTTQQAAFDHEDVAPRLEQFQDTLFSKMTELDPSTPGLVERAGELMEEMQ